VTSNDKLLSEETSLRTVGHYETNAERFRDGTYDHDVSQNVASLLDNIIAEPPFNILDLGCGPGRDLKTFRDLGHNATGLDGSRAFVEMAKRYSGCEVLLQDFLDLDLPMNQFDGIFANAVLFHVPSGNLASVLTVLYASLRIGGVLFTSNPRGDNREVWNGDRYGVYHDLTQWRRYLTTANFVEIDHYYRPPGVPRAEQPWLATVWRRAT
jgi:SAM-dependent methyltransferase